MTRFRLADALKAKGLTQYRLAKLSRVSMSTVQRIYHNKTRQVHLDVLDAFARVLGCLPGDLIERR